MSKQATNLTTKLQSLPKGQRILIYAAVFAAIGILLLAITKAAGPFVAVEPENATLTSSASVGSDASASGGRYAQFGEAATYPGQPPVGKLLWGAAVSSNGDPVPRHEIPANHILTVRRTFFQWSHRTGYMITIATDDLANGRLPWVSLKTPSWADMGAGLHDSEIDEMLTALEGLNGPIWLTIHHEPEGGGGNNFPDDPAGPVGHVAMNRRVRERMTALGTKNIALSPVLMGWTFNPASGRNPDEWWEPGIYDFLGLDPYVFTEDTMITPAWLTSRLWAEERNVDIAVAEWGMQGSDAAAGSRMQEWYDHAANSWNDGLGARVTGLTVFDSEVGGDWVLEGEQLTTFWDLLNDSRTFDAI